MGKQKLARHVTVAGTTYGPGDDVPDDVVKQITNPKAWIPEGADEDEDEDEGRDAGTAGGHKLATTVTIGGKSYGPKDHIPDGVAASITNPKAWVDGKAPAAKPAVAAPDFDKGTDLELSDAAWKAKYGNLPRPDKGEDSGPPAPGATTPGVTPVKKATAGAEKRA